MPADTILWIALGTLLFLGYAIVGAFVLGQVPMRGDREVEVEVKAASLSVRVRASRSRSGVVHGEGSNTAVAGSPKESNETGGDNPD